MQRQEGLRPAHLYLPRASMACHPACIRPNCRFPCSLSRQNLQIALLRGILLCTVTRQRSGGGILSGFSAYPDRKPHVQSAGQAWKPPYLALFRSRWQISHGTQRLECEITMDWVKDYAIVNRGDVDRVFRFDPQLTTVVRLLNCDEVS